MQKNWYRLDTAALIFPATIRRDWCNVFRLSAGLTEPVDPAILQQATDDLRKRFPSYFVTLRRGAFWYYLEESSDPVQVREDYAYPLVFMSGAELKHNCLRVLYYRNRIAVEFFHSLTDGRGGSVFLANLVARYLELKRGVDIPRTELIRNPAEGPREEELEDSFLKNAAEVQADRTEEVSYRLHGTPEKKGFRSLTTGIVETEALIETAHRFHVSVTAFLAAVMTESIISMQNEERPRRNQRPVKITLPVDLRRLYGSKTLRNFSLVLNIGVDPRFGDYSLEELCNTKLIVLRLAPVFLKNIVMNAVYQRTGESFGCLNISNITNVDLPEEMRPYIERMEFIIGPQRSYPNNCSVLSYGGRTYINMIRNIRESELERRFFSRLVDLGLAVEIESNRR